MTPDYSANNNRSILIDISSIHSINFMRVLMFTFFLICAHIDMVSQVEHYKTNSVYSELQALKTENELPNFNLFSMLETNVRESDKAFVADAVYLNLIKGDIRELLTSNKEVIEVRIPTNSDTIILELFEVRILAENFKLMDCDGKEYYNNIPRFFRGTVKNDPNSFAIASFYEDEVRIEYSDLISNYRVQKTKDGDYIYFTEQDLLVQSTLNCSASDPRLDKEVAKFVGNNKSVDAGNCVEVYLECDYQMFLDNDSDVIKTENYVTSLMNEVITLYAVEEITITISEIFVWNSPDPYAIMFDPIQILYAFQEQKNASGYEGKLGHLLSTRGFGGVAFRDVLCIDTAGYGISTSLSNNILPFPLYSGSVKLITHELGHNFGSPHTHDCVWNGNDTQIDDCGNIGGTKICYDPDNPIIPEDGGTMMSYCNINFLKGFGLQPGDMIRERYNNAPCNTGCGDTDPPQAPQNLICTAKSSTWMHVTWDRSEDAIGYKIYRSHESQSDYSIIATVNSDDTLYIDIGLIPETYYCYKVKSYGEGGDSDFSVSDCDTLPAGGSIIATIDSVAGCPGLFTVPILLKNAQDAYSFILKLDYQTDEIEFLESQNEHPALSAGNFVFDESNGLITIFWLSSNPLSISNDVLLDLVFECDPVNISSVVRWDTIGTNCNFKDYQGNSLATNYINGIVVSEPLIDEIEKPVGADTVCVNVDSQTDYFVLPGEETATWQWILTPPESGILVENNNELSITWNADVQLPVSVNLHVKAGNNCNDVVSPVLSVYLADSSYCGVGIGENPDSYPAINIYPNPSDGMLTVEFDGIDNATTLYLTDSFGKTVYSQSLNKLNSNKTAYINLPDLPPGLYHVNVENAVAKFVKKLIVK
jgi:metallopeptidase family M12-like protein/type IX secretion system substrate protein/fibronectin type III domain protein